MAMGVVVREVFNNLPKIADNLDNDVYQIIRLGAQDVTARARQLVPVDTGALKASIYIVNEKGTNYNFATYASQNKIENSYKGGFSEEILPAESYRAGKHTIIVAAAAPYAGYVEYGHATRGGGYVPARPYLEPAYEEVVPTIYEKLNRMFDSYGG